MLQLAASLLLVALLGAGTQSPGQSRPTLVATPQAAPFRQAPNRVDPAYQQLAPSFVTLMGNDAPLGPAVMIDPSGLYLAHRASVYGPEVFGRFGSGKTVHFRVLAEDGCSQLVLLKCSEVPADARAVSAATTELDPGTPVLVVLTEGAVHARVVTTDKVGIIQPSNRMLPLTEIRFESATVPIGGGLVFTLNGDLLGVLSATLPRTTNQRAYNIADNVNQKFAGGLGGGGRFSPGPAQLTVAYTPGTDVIRNAVEGFLSPSHEVEHPSLGVFCRDGAGGAYIVSVQADSAAARAGIRAGDLIKGIGGYMIRNQRDFAKVMFRLHPSARVIVLWDRNGRQESHEVLIGKTTD